MDNQNQNPNQETDVLVLLEYFKTGIKNFFRGIGILFKYFINLILQVFILLKRHWILILACVIPLSIIGHFNKQLLPPSYIYEMVVQPNFGSVRSLYQLADSYNELSGTEDSFFKNIKQIKVLPVKSFTNDLSVFYSIIANNNLDKRDTIFSKEYKIENFRKRIVSTDYPLQTVIIKSSTPLSSKEIKNRFLDPIENDPYFSQYKNSILKSLDIRTLYYKRDLQKIDTLLSALAASDRSGIKSTASLSIKGEAANNLEDDLLKRSSQITGNLASIEIDRNTYSQVIKVISDPQLTDKSRLIKRNAVSFALCGFIFSVLIIFSIQFIKYLNKFEKENS